MKKLTLAKDVRAAMLRAARAAAPLEACGLCAGRNGYLNRFYELDNADASGEHYRMLPEQQFAAVKDMRSRGIELLALWHSHPATPARMSDEDLKLAYTPNVVYLVLSLADPDAPDVRGFTVNDGCPAEVALVTDGDGEER